MCSRHKRTQVRGRWNGPTENLRRTTPKVRCLMTPASYGIYDLNIGIIINLSREINSVWSDHITEPLQWVDH